QITLKYRDLWDDETRDLMAWQEANPRALEVHFTADVEESMALNDIREGAVIISSSGMCDAGRIKHHLAYNLPRPESTVLITGFQAAGSLGRRLVDGARTVRLFGQIVPVRADIYTVGGLSAHGDQQALLDWVGHFHRAPAQTRVVHGEAEAAQALRDAIERRYGWSNVLVARGNDPIIV
ncbi:MAG TPA: MBL fold metallo-hydrolase RNA specificity domain-containing protein, partial [Azospira sp.]|nr:MBL fold metallo-hydrolase RNA specificity domain-containing protein [Azospira sp.]